MPKARERKTNKASWSEEAMRGAIQAVREGSTTIREASRRYSVPFSSLRDRLNRGYYAPSMGRNAVFSKEQEAEIKEQLLTLSQMFYGLTPLQLRLAAYEYAEVNKIPNSFNKIKKLAGKDWLYGFMARNPELSFRKPEATSLNRVTAFNKIEVDRFFENLEKVMSTHKFNPTKIFNMDETGITTCHKPARIVGPKGQKQVGAITSLERGKTTTVCCAMSAAGTFVPPMFIFARLRMASGLERNGPPGSIYQCSKNGWINEDLFRVWLRHFVNFTNVSKENPVLLIVDNHASHSSLNIYNFCRNNGVIMLSIPPHTSHRLQPLDLTFFGPLKKAYNMECELFMKSHAYQKITNTDLPGLFTKAYLKVAVAQRAVKGFETAGIFPMNPDVFGDLDYSVSEPDKESTKNLAMSNIQTVPEPESIQPVAGCSGIQPKSIEPIAGCSGNQTNTIRSKSFSFSQISPKPVPRITLTRKVIKRKKQRSEILTSTPNKEQLEILEAKRKKNLEKSAGKINGSKNENMQTRKKATKRKVFDSESSGDDEEPIIDDDEVDDMEMSDNELGELKSTYLAPLVGSCNFSFLISDAIKQKEQSDEKCIICNEFGKNELWFRCSTCGQWAHASCTGADRPHGYICDFCIP